MRSLGQVLPRRGSARAGVTALAIVALVVTAGGAAWAAHNVTNERPYSGANTVTVDLTPPGTAGDSVEANVLRIGGAQFWGRCWTVNDETSGFGVNVAFGVTNVGDHTLVVTQPPTQEFPDMNAWLEPGQRDPVFGAGQGRIGTDRGASLLPFAVFDEGGTSASGTVAWVIYSDASDQTGRCTFTVQGRG